METRSAGIVSRGEARIETARRDEALGRWLMETNRPADFDPTKITRPSPVLLNYYVLTTAVATVFIIPITLIALLPSLFKYRTLRYRFDDEGISMAWGMLFRREINLTYRRIQDIHVTRNLFQRWMGLATVAIQTASGSATPEMSIEGILQVDELRDFLYSKMRGARGEAEPEAEESEPADEALRLLHEIRDELAALRGASKTAGSQSGEVL
jgi:putative membrane protein